MATKTCVCAAFEFGTFEPNSDSDYGTECRRTTTNIFAQGHDAKLVGFLVRAELAGDEIRVNNNGVVHSFHGAVHAAGTISEALAAKAQYQLDAARARLAKKELREANKAARKSAKAVKVAETPKDRDARIKVGRWTYDAVIDGKTGWATYTKKSGDSVHVAPTNFQEV